MKAEKPLAATPVKAIVMRPLRAFACRLSFSDHETVIHARTSGDAKSRFWRLLDCDFKYTDIRCRCVGGPVTTPDIERTAKYRGVEFVRAGMTVIVDGVTGVIVGQNSSANWDVLFDEGTKWGGQVLNCHPTWEIAYLADDGSVLCDFRKAAAVSA